MKWVWVSVLLMVVPVQEKNSWHLLNVELEPSAREAVEYALMEAGALERKPTNHRAGCCE